MRNIISGKTLAEAVAEGGLKAAREFPIRCTGHTTGGALYYIGQLMRKQQLNPNGGECLIFIEGGDILDMIPDIIKKLGLVGFRIEKGFDGGRLYYRAFEGD